MRSSTKGECIIYLLRRNLINQEYQNQTFSKKEEWSKVSNQWQPIVLVCYYPGPTAMKYIKNVRIEISITHTE